MALAGDVVIAAAEGESAAAKYVWKKPEIAIALPDERDNINKKEKNQGKCLQFTNYLMNTIF